MSEPSELEIKVARIISPTAIMKYDQAVAEGWKAANGKPWADVAYGANRDMVIQMARACIAAVMGG